jgi:hypothetical protein
MPSIDGSYVRILQTACRDHAQINPGTKTTANVFSKVKAAVASAFRMPAPAMALA